MFSTIVLLFGIMIPHVQADGIKSLTVDIYPGFGWDHLRFLDMNSLFDVVNFNDSESFQSCIDVIPVRRNRIEMGSTLIDMYDARTTDFASHLFIGGGGGYLGFKISGSYSNEYATSKKEQGEEKTLTLHNQIDYILCDVLLKATCPLNSKVKQELIQIARYQANNQTAMATYAAQLFVKNYGTHYTKRLSLGGSIMQDDYIKESIYRTETNESKSYQAAAEASFLGTFSLSAKFSSSSSTDDNRVNQAKQKFTRKVVNSRGGRVSLSNGSMDTWQSSIESAPVVVQRGIENLTLIIQSENIPELSENELAFVQQKINEATNAYILMNVHSGCMDRSSPSFNWIANVEDGSCKSAEENLQFGGFIRTCVEDSRINQ